MALPEAHRALGMEEGSLDVPERLRIYRLERCIQAEADGERERARRVDSERFVNRMLLVFLATLACLALLCAGLCHAPEYASFDGATPTMASQEVER